MENPRPVIAPKRIAIIGAGCSGLTAIKSCLDEGLEPVCFEKSPSLGGLWNYSDTVEAGRASIYRSLVINTSKDMMMFSDFPAPDHFPPFLTHHKVMEYFQLYADHFKLYRRISFNTTVLHIQKASDYDDSGEWCVRFLKKRTDNNNSSTDDVANNSPREEIFQGVMICTGHHSFPFVPKIDGIDSFCGEILHSHSYKSPETFQDKTVLILGLGNSAADIACDLAKTAKKVVLSSRRGAWIVPRTAFWGLPADMLANSRLVFTLPYCVLDWCVQKQANFRIDHKTYGLQPNHGVLSCHPSINDELPIHLVNGRVQVKANVRRVEKDGVLLDDDTFVPCDVIIMATGYDYRLDFVSPDVLKIEKNRTDLYQFMFPAHLPHPTLAVIGLIQAIGAVMPISEIQSRWFARLMRGAVNLPSKEVMLQDIESKRQAMDAIYVKSRRHTLQTFWIEYMDTIASLIRAKPNLWKIMLTDPELALKCYLGPCFPAQYRLTGPGQWPEARQFIISAMSRALKPKIAPRVAETNDKSSAKQKSKVQTEQYSSTPDNHHSCTSTSDILVQTGVRQYTDDASRLPSSCQDNADRTVYSPANTTSRHRWHPEWMTMTFYATLLSFCCLAWAIAVFLDKAEILLSFFEQTVGRYLPLGD